jgi:hypothetical protein
MYGVCVGQNFTFFSNGYVTAVRKRLRRQVALPESTGPRQVSVIGTR